MIPLYHITTPGNYISNPRPKHIGHTSVTEIAVTFCEAALRHTDMLKRSEYQVGGCIPPSHPPWTNKMNNTSWLLQFDLVYRSCITASQRRLMLWKEQKSVAWMNYLVSRVSGPQDLVVEFCMETIAVAKACLLFSAHQRFMGSEPDESCTKILTKTTWSLQKTIA